MLLVAVILFLTPLCFCFSINEGNGIARLSVEFNGNDQDFKGQVHLVAFAGDKFYECTLSPSTLHNPTGWYYCDTSTFKYKPTDEGTTYMMLDVQDCCSRQNDHLKVKTLKFQIGGTSSTLTITNFKSQSCKNDYDVYDNQKKIKLKDVTRVFKFSVDSFTSQFQRAKVSCEQFFQTSTPSSCC